MKPELEQDLTAAETPASELAERLARLNAPEMTVPVVRDGVEFVVCVTRREADATPPANDPAEWSTGNEPMTASRRSYLKTLCDEAREDFDDTLTKADTTRRIDEL